MSKRGYKCRNLYGIYTWAQMNTWQDCIKIKRACESVVKFENFNDDI